jgi:hypothetical protein
MEFAGKHRLVAHSDHPPRTVRWVEVEVAVGDRISLTYAVEPATGLFLPDQGADRKDALWRSTCFELFAKQPGSAGYREFNFAPPGAWNAYSFSDWREGMRPLEVAEPPHLSERRGGLPARYEMEVTLSRNALGAGLVSVSLTTIVEEGDGIFSYWALAHGGGEPDFHQPACFAAALPAIAAR